MSTTFANTIDGNKIYADRAEHDAAGNDIQQTYATKSELPTFSEAQQAAIDSGVTSTKVGNYDTHVADTTIHVTAQDKSTWNAKQDAISDLSTIRSGAALGATAVQPGDLATVASTGDYDDLLNKPTIPAAQVQSDWSEADSSAVDYIKNKPQNLVQDASYVHTDNNFTTALKDKLDGIASGAEVNVQSNWNESDSSSDAYIQNKPQNLVQDASYVHTDNNFTTSEKDKLAGIASGAEVNVQANWTEADSSSDAYIQNKPTLATVATSGSYNDLLDKPTIPTIPVTDVEVDGSSVVNAQGVAEITLPTFTQEQADWTEADNTDPAYIKNKPSVMPIAAGANITLTESQGSVVISAAASAQQQQADWNQTDSSAVDYIKNKPNIPAAQVQSNWSESNSSAVSFIQNKPAVLPVIAGSNITITQDSNGVTIASTARGSVTDVEVNGTSVVSGGVASITVPAQVQADWTEADNTDPSYIQNKPTLAAVATSGSYTDLSNTPTIPTVPVQDVTVNGSSVVSNGTAAVSVPVTDVTVDGTSVVSNGTAAITMPTFTQEQADWTEADSNDPAYIKNKPTLAAVATSGSYTDLSNTPTIPAAPVQSNWTESDNTSLAYIQNKPTLAAVATSGAYSDLSGTPTISNVPAVTSNDDGKILKAAYSGGTGSYSWQTESGAVTDVTVDGTSVVSNGVAAITMPVQQQADWSETDTTAVTYIDNKPDLVDIVAGPGIVVDNPDGNTLRVSMAADYEVELWAGDTGQIISSTIDSCTLSEAATNFEYLKIYVRGSAINGGTNPGNFVIEIHPVSDTAMYYPLTVSYTNDGTSVFTDVCRVTINGTSFLYDKGFRTAINSSTNAVSSQNNRGPAITRIVGINRISGGN